MSDQNERNQEIVHKVFSIDPNKARAEWIDRINKDQYQDELDHKEWMYDAVKSTLKLCEVMVKAIEPTSDNEAYARKTLLDSLEIARQSALMCAIDVGTEKRGLGK